MESQVDDVADRLEVADTITRLFVNTDERNWPAVTDCFAQRVLFDMASLTGKKASRVAAKRIVDQWRTGLGGLAAVHHQVGNLLVKVEGSEAYGFCYATATHYLPNQGGDGDTRTFVGTYDIHLVRGDDGWRIDAFRFNLKFVQGNLRLGEPAEPSRGRQA
ncbi:MAG: nuclear transport factor 2 family protein [Nitrososphaerales archaeon]|jgi:hypothetical protein